MCATEIPDPEIESGFEDTESIEDDIDSLYSKFIKPIDSLRSISEPPKDQNQSNQSEPQAIKNLNVDAVNALESRIHTFYRMLGLPVVGGSSYYNPGFDPNPKTQTVRSSVNSKITDTNKKLFNDREQLPRLFQQLFAAQGFDATAFGLMMTSPKFFNIIDNQEIPHENRENKLYDKAMLSDSMYENIRQGETSFQLRFGYPITSAKHILKPFAVNPAIDYTVMPMNNKIAVPFLKDLQATKISNNNPDIFLNRPGIEFIVRARLKDNVPDKIFFSNLEKAITKIKSPTTDIEASIDVRTIKETLAAFAGEADVTDVDLNEVFSGFTSTQAVVVRQLIKTIKVCIKLLHKAVSDLDKLRESEDGITLLPIPATTGFINGGTNRDYTGTILEQNLARLGILKLNADRDAEIERGLGTFCTAQFVNMQKADTFQRQIQELQERKKSLEKTALKHLRTIEIITGEASGCGLVDVLAVYTALWAIKIDDLLVLLDQDSIERLYNFNVNLRSDEVNKRKNSPGSISSALSALENKVVSILTFADKLYDESFSSQIVEGGTPA